MDSYSLLIGYIEAYSPKTNTYSVCVWGSQNRIYHNCMYLGEDSGRLFGPKKSQKLSCGTYVVFFGSKDVDLGYILGTTSFRDLDFTPDTYPLIPFSNTPEDYNWATDDVLANAVNFNDLVSNFSQEDGYPGFSAGSSSELGSGYGHTASTAYVKSSEMAGVWSFLMDNTLRVAGFNFEFWHSGGEREIKSYNGQIEDMDRSTPFLWESLGFNSPDYVDDLEIPEDIKQGVAIGDPKKISALYKLTQAHARELGYPHALYRHMKLRDAQGETEWVLKQGTIDHRGRPNQATGLNEVSQSNTLCNAVTDPSEPVTTGLSKILKGLDGRIKMQSAKSLELIKDLRIPVPHRIDKPETVGDEFTNNWKDDLDNGALTSSFNDSDYERPALSKFEHEVPPSQELKIRVDDETGEKYYSSQSFIKQTEDGSIVLQDGYGSSITLSKGNIYLSCPGDIINLAGRDSITWAGADIMAKAQNNLELSASRENVRIKAEKQLSMLGGNSGAGGVLIASQAVGVGVAQPTHGGNDMTSGGVVLSSESFIGLGADYIAASPKNLEKVEFTIQGRLSTEFLNASFGNVANFYSDLVNIVTANIVTANIVTLTASTGSFGGVANTCITAGFAATAGLAKEGTPIPLVPTPIPVTVNPVPVDSAPYYVQTVGPQFTDLIKFSAIGQAPIAPIALFTFRSAEELGYTGDYNFNIPEQTWEKMATATWDEPLVNGSFPHPASAMTIKTTTK